MNAEKFKALVQYDPHEGQLEVVNEILETIGDGKIPIIKMHRLVVERPLLQLQVGLKCSIQTWQRK